MITSTLQERKERGLTIQLANARHSHSRDAVDAQPVLRAKADGDRVRVCEEPVLGPVEARVGNANDIRHH